MMTVQHLLATHRGDVGFTLIESVMSILIVGLFLVAALNTVGASRVTQSRSVEQLKGQALAEELLAEIVNQHYQEPDNTVAFGRETGESSGNRGAWDDVDDYHGWSASPPEKKNGDPLEGMNGWSREVEISWVNSVNPNVPSVVETGIKRVRVTVKYNLRIVAQLDALRTNGWPEDPTGPADPDLIESLLGGTLDALRG